MRLALTLALSSTSRIAVAAGTDRTADTTAAKADTTTLTADRS